MAIVVLPPRRISTWDYGLSSPDRVRIHFEQYIQKRGKAGISPCRVGKYQGFAMLAAEKGQQTIPNCYEIETGTNRGTVGRSALVVEIRWLQGKDLIRHTLDAGPFALQKDETQLVSAAGYWAKA